MRSTRASRSSGVHVRLGEIETASRSEAEEIGLRLFVGQRSATAASSTSPRTPFDDGRALLAMANEAPRRPYAGLAPTEMLTAATCRTRRRRPARAGCVRASRARARSRESGDGRGGHHQLEGRRGEFGDDNGARDLGRFLGAYRVTGHGCSASSLPARGRPCGAITPGIAAGTCPTSSPPPRSAGGPANGDFEAQSVAPEARQISGSVRRPVSSTLLGHLAGAISGSSIARRTSFPQARNPVFTPGVTIVDDPLRSRGLRSRPFDAEGLRVSRQELVSDGILNSWMAESASARQLGIAPTGTRRAGRGAERRAEQLLHGGGATKPRRAACRIPRSGSRRRADRAGRQSGHGRLQPRRGGLHGSGAARSPSRSPRSRSPRT